MDVTRRYGSGTVYPLPNGRWAGQASNGTDELGNRLRVSVIADTEAGAWKALTEARGKPSTSRRRGGETVEAFLGRWLDDVVRVKRKERTLVGYRTIIDLHIVPDLGDILLRSLTRRQVQAWVARQQGAPLSIRHRVDCLRSALSYAVRWNLIPANPATDLDLPAAPKRVVRALRPEDARAVLEATAETWFAPLVTVALYTGLRQGELLGLRWQDVDLRAGTLTVHQALARLPGKVKLAGRRGRTRYTFDTPKSATSRRTIPLSPTVLDTLREFQRAQMQRAGSWKGLVFAHPERPIDASHLTRDFQAALKRAELPTMRWHDLRHATASLLIAEGVSLAVVSSILGHSGIAITVDTYGHLTDDTKREAMNVLGRAVG